MKYRKHSEASTDSADVGRRKFLKGGIAGACALCLGGGAAGVYLYGRGSQEDKGEAPDGSGFRDSNGAPDAGAKRARGADGARRSQWFEAAADGVLVCTLCPKRCRIEPDTRGPCRVRENRGGSGYTLAYGNPALVRVDPVERLPFLHVFPGSRTLAISTAGCPLACSFCEVWDMALVAPEEIHSYDVPPNRVIEQAKADNATSVSYAFGEPVAYFEYMHDTAVRAKEAGMLNLLHTSAYIEAEPLSALTDVLDAANVDLKSFDPEFYRDVVGGELEPVLERTKQLRRAGVHIEITNIVIPTLNDDMDNIARMARWIRNELGGDTPVHFARFYPLYKLGNLPPTPVSTLEEARATAREAGLNHVYISRVDGHEAESTYCPGCGTTVIERLGFVIEAMNLQDGRCPECGTDIPGLWA